MAFRIGRSVTQVFDADRVVVGFDARETSPSLANEVAKGICQAGGNVLMIGLSGTEEMYWAVTEFGADAGIQVTASHNPIDYNGMKIIKAKSKPLSEKEFFDIKVLAETTNFSQTKKIGMILDRQNKARNAYLNKIVSFVDLQKLKPLKIVFNSGNGTAGPTLDMLKKLLVKKGVKTKFCFIQHSPDSSFPNGIPNPLLKENRSSTAEAVKQNQADFGVAFDGDFDRCFFFDNQGEFIPSQYITSLLAEVFLKREPGSKIVHDPRVTWSTIDTVERFKGVAVVSKTGHAFFKETMRFSKAIYGGEMSAHHYFRDFANCDSGMIPWLLVWELVSSSQRYLAGFTNNKKQIFPSSDEMNFKVENADACIEFVRDVFSPNAISIDDIDGLSIYFERWRFNLRKSNTEPLVRLNIETAGDLKLLQEKSKKLERIIKNL